MRRPTDRDLSCVWCAIGRTGWPPTDKPPAGPGRAARTDERHVPCNSPPVRYLTSVGSRRCRQCDGRPTSVHEGIAPTSQEVRKILVAASYLSICYCSVLSTHSSTLWRRLKLSNCSMVWYPIHSSSLKPNIVIVTRGVNNRCSVKDYSRPSTNMGLYFGDNTILCECGIIFPRRTKMLDDERVLERVVKQGAFNTPAKY